MTKKEIEKIYYSRKELKPIKKVDLFTTKDEAIKEAEKEVLENDDLYISLFYKNNNHHIGSFIKR